MVASLVLVTRPVRGVDARRSVGLDQVRGKLFRDMQAFALEMYAIGCIEGVYDYS
jgi:hypothetical protein